MLENPKVLVVDDDNMITNLLLTYLPQFGFNVTGFTDSIKALEAIHENQYDVVLTDLVMPKVSGLDIVRAVNETGADTQIIIATGFATTESAIKAVQFGVYDYIRKPFSPSEIRIVLSRAVEKLKIMRENNELHARIGKMLSNMTMLHNISTILYQVTDFNLIVDMVLDTITEGFSIDRVGIFLFDTENSDYRIYRSKGISDALVNVLAFDSNDLIAGQRLSVQDDSPVHTNEQIIQIEPGTIGDDPAQAIGLYPILYQEKLFGFVGILQDETESKNTDKDQLMKILTTQIAPVFSVRNRKYQQSGEFQLSNLPYYEMVNSVLTEAANENRSELFALVKLAPVLSGMIPTDFADVCLKFRNWSNEEFGKDAGIYWLEPDRLLVNNSHKSMVSMELSCVNLRSHLEEYTVGKHGKPAISLKYNIAAFPEDARTAEDLILKLNETVFYESHTESRQETSERVY